MGLPVPYYNLGYLYYDNLGTIGNKDYWEFVRKYAYSQGYMDSIVEDNMEIDKIASTLEAQGRAELAKERQVLSQFFGTEINITEDQLVNDPTCYSNYLAAINDAFGIRDVWQRVVKKVGSGVGHTRDIQFAKIYGSYLESEVAKALPKFARDVYPKYIEKEDFDGLDAAWKKRMDKAMTDALKATLQAPEFKGSKNTPYAELLQVIERTNDFTKRFNSQFFTAFGLDQVNQELLVSLNQVREGMLKDTGKVQWKALHGMVRSKYHQKMNAYQLGGLVGEYFTELFMRNSVKNIKSDLKQKGFDMSAVVAGSTKSKSSNTDVITIGGQGVTEMMSADLLMQAQIDVDAVTQEIGIKERERLIAQRFSELLDQHIKDGFVVYESTKAYTINDGRFFQGTSYNLDSLRSLLKEMKVTNAMRFLTTVMNTAQGAIFDDKKQLIQANASAALSQGVANMLFDDFKTIGNNPGSNTALHIFRLTEIVVPLSFLLLKTAHAMREGIKNARQYVKINFTLGRRLYSNEDYERGMDPMASRERWNKQKEENLNTFNVTIDFLGNFAQLLEGDLYNFILSQ